MQNSLLLVRMAAALLLTVVTALMCLCLLHRVCIPTCQLRETKVHGFFQQLIDQHKVALDAVLIQLALKVGAEEVDQLQEGRGEVCMLRCW